MYVPYLLNPFICQWAFRLFPTLGYYKQCCSEHRCAYIFLNYSFVWVYTHTWDCWVIWKLLLDFGGTSTQFSIVATQIYILTNSVVGVPHPLWHLLSADVFDNGISGWIFDLSRLNMPDTELLITLSTNSFSSPPHARNTAVNLDCSLLSPRCNPSMCIHAR